jgi:tRNA/tmRNA/rRNA uracil-C5-methylase (TrmA/RlmC/RlmD family)
MATRFVFLDQFGNFNSNRQKLSSVKGTFVSLGLTFKNKIRVHFRDEEKDIILILKKEDVNTTLLLSRLCHLLRTKLSLLISITKNNEGYEGYRIYDNDEHYKESILTREALQAVKATPAIELMKYNTLIVQTTNEQIERNREERLKKHAQQQGTKYV